MRLISCYVDGFGKLNETAVDFHEGCNTFIRENGWGKSTLVAFLRVMFYGFDGETKRNDMENERRRYRPWAGGVYGGELVFETGGRVYRLQRVFGARKSEDTFALYDMEANALSRDFTENIGEELFGIDVGTFARTVYIGQRDAVTWATDGLAAKLGNVAAGTDDIRNYELAAKRLKDEINRMSPARKTGEIYRLRSQLADMKDEARRIDDINRRIELTKKRRQDNGRSRERLIMYDSLKKRLDMAGSYFPGALPDDETLADMIEEARELEREEARLENAPNVSSENRNNLMLWAQALAVMLVCVISFMVAGRTGSSELAHLIQACGVVVFAASVVWLVVSIRRNTGGERTVDVKARDRCEELSEDIYTYIEELGFEPADDVLAQLIEIRTKSDEYRSISRELEGFKGEAPGGEPGGEKGFDDEGLTALHVELAAACEHAQKIPGAQAELDKKLHRYDLTTNAYELLELAKQTFVSKYNAPVMDAFSRLYSCAAGAPANDFMLDSELRLCYRSQGLYRDSATLSEGQGDVANVCLRLAFVEAMYGAEKPFLVLDDTFAGLDDRNMTGVRRLMDELARRYQIIYFTCSGSRIVS